MIDHATTRTVDRTARGTRIRDRRAGSRIVRMTFAGPQFR